MRKKWAKWEKKWEMIWKEQEWAWERAEKKTDYSVLRKLAWNFSRLLSWLLRDYGGNQTQCGSLSPRLLPSVAMVAARLVGYRGPVWPLGAGSLLSSPLIGREHILDPHLTPIKLFNIPTCFWPLKRHTARIFPIPLTVFMIDVQFGKKYLSL